MTVIDVQRDPITKQYTITLRITEEVALDLARRIVAEAEKTIEVTTDRPPQQQEPQ